MDYTDRDLKKALAAVKRTLKPYVGRLSAQRSFLDEDPILFDGIEFTDEVTRLVVLVARGKTARPPRYFLNIYLGRSLNDNYVSESYESLSDLIDGIEQHVAAAAASRFERVA